ncbi:MULTISPECIES: DUF4149 domain-containing protein [Bordetella]|uniref:TMEM205-like domain-containing protein n=1 Tax=Bordetella genomosp. 2 TaxID=1983456 RepID=A0A261VRP1_9BORD|nr:MULTISPECIES: DUF4149 domain-containing protein [Bordetella]OZI76719.1 hypothetical protein CAL24_16610 [Bordetella genomosp. 2]
MPNLARILVRLIAALWCGALWCIGALVAPTSFSMLDAAVAAEVVARMFQVLAMGGLGGAVIMLILDRLAHGQALQGPGRRTVLLMAVGTGIGYFGLNTLMDHGRALAAAGQAVPAWADPGLLHNVSGGIYFLVALAALRLVAVAR